VIQLIQLDTKLDLNVKVVGQSSRPEKENVAKVVGATSSEGFLQ